VFVLFGLQKQTLTIKPSEPKKPAAQISFQAVEGRIYPRSHPKMALQHKQLPYLSCLLPSVFFPPDQRRSFPWLGVMLRLLHGTLGTKVQALSCEPKWEQQGLGQELRAHLEVPE
jgi:hypothetical protein